MATEVKVGGKNDLYALREARRLRNEAWNKVDSAIRHLNFIREAGGRGDIAGVVALLGNTMVDLAKVNRHHDEMLNIREQNGVVEVTALEERVVTLEAQMAELQRLLQQTWILPEQKERA